MTDRLTPQIAFLIEADKLKHVISPQRRGDTEGVRSSQICTVRPVPPPCISVPQYLRGETPKKLRGFFRNKKFS
jgi:hypothetical protein